MRCTVHRLDASQEGGLDMSTDLTLFTHPVFGNLRTIVDGETIYICAKDAATALGYSNTNDNSRIHAPGKTS